MYGLHAAQGLGTLPAAQQRVASACPAHLPFRRHSEKPPFSTLMFCTPEQTASYAAQQDRRQHTLCPLQHQRLCSPAISDLQHKSAQQLAWQQDSPQPAHLLCMPDSELDTGSRVPPRLHTKMACQPRVRQSLW